MSIKNNAIFDKGKKRKSFIIEQAISLLINQGYYNFSMRNVAQQADISLGSLQYYFPSKKLLIATILDTTIQMYLDNFDRIRHSGNPIEQLHAIVEFVMLDLQLKSSTYLFPELWSMANHDKAVRLAVDVMYEKYRVILTATISDINNDLSVKQAKKIALFISSSIEGHTMFIGYKKSHTSEVNHLIKIACQSFIFLIEKGDIPA